MKWWLLFLCGWAAFAAAKAAGIPCQVRLLNGDRLEVAYLGQEGEESLFESSWQTSPIRIHGKFIEAIDFGKKSRGVTGDWVIFFDQDQWIRGQVLAMNEGRLNLETAWDGPLSLEMRYVNKIVRAIPEEDILFQGPTARGEARLADSALSSYGLRLPVGESTLNLPKVEGSFAIRMVLQIPDVSSGDLSGFSLDGFPLILQAGGRGGRSLRFHFSQKGLGVEQVGPFIIRGGMVINQQRSVTLPVPRGHDVVMTVAYDEPKNITRVKLGSELLFERDEGPLENLNALSKPELTFFIKSSSQTYLLSELLMYRYRPLGQGEGSEIPADKESILFVNGDVFEAEWLGVDGDGNWRLKSLTLDQVTPMDPARIFAWTANEETHYPMRRKARHVQLQLAGGSGRFLVEFLRSDASTFTFRREGWQGEFAIPFSQIERLRFNPYFR